MKSGYTCRGATHDFSSAVQPTVFDMSVVSFASEEPSSDNFNVNVGKGTNDRVDYSPLHPGGITAVTSATKCSNQESDKTETVMGSADVRASDGDPRLSLKQKGFIDSQSAGLSNPVGCNERKPSFYASGDCPQRLTNVLVKPYSGCVDQQHNTKGIAPSSRGCSSGARDGRRTTGSNRDDSKDAASPGWENTNSRRDAALQRLLHDASKVRGIGTKSLFCGLLVPFILLLISMIVGMNSLLSEKVTAGRLDSTKRLTTVAMDRLSGIYDNVRSMAGLLPILGHLNAESKLTLLGEHYCSQLQKTPLLLAAYSSLNGSLIWSHSCSSAEDSSVVPLKTLRIGGSPTAVPYMAVYKSDYIIIGADSGGGSGVFAVTIRKDAIGQLVLGNSSDGSRGPKGGPVVAILMRNISSSSLAVASLSSKEEDDEDVGPSVIPHDGDFLRLFNVFCSSKEGQTPHWASDVHAENSSSELPVSGTSILSTLQLYVEDEGFFGDTPFVAACGSLCLDSDSRCWGQLVSNSIRFIAHDRSVAHETGVVYTVGMVVSYASAFLFLGILGIAYISINSPIEQLKLLVITTVGCDRSGRGMPSASRRLRLFWLRDLYALVNTFQILSLCFQLNKKYVPQHILEQHVVDLLNFSCGLLGDDADEPTVMKVPDGKTGDGDGVEEADPEDMEAFVNAATTLGVAASTTRRQEQRTQSVVSYSRGHTVSDLMSSINRRQALKSYSAHPFSRHPSVNEAALQSATDCPAETREGVVTITAQHGDALHRGMAVVDSATVLTVHFPAVELAYFTDFEVALKQHRRIMTLLLRCVRRYRGELFHRSGEGIAVAWNAFECRSDHANRAAACALSISEGLEPYRRAGFKVGIVLHQGPFVCGVVEDNTEAFTTVFGSVPRQAHVFSDLAASLPYFNILVSEPVKEALSSHYECIMVDVIKCDEYDHSITLFELSRHRQLPQAEGVLLSPSAFAEDHARVFSNFRNHDFDLALAGVESMRANYPTTEAHLLLRIEQLCKYYKQNDKDLPRPYCRHFPTWRIYEAVDDNDPSPEFLTIPYKEVGLPGDVPRGAMAHKSSIEYDTMRFRQDLHDNVLASQRAGIKGVNKSSGKERRVELKPRLTSREVVVGAPPELNMDPKQQPTKSEAKMEMEGPWQPLTFTLPRDALECAHADRAGSCAANVTEAAQPPAVELGGLAVSDVNNSRSVSPTHLKEDDEEGDCNDGKVEIQGGRQRFSFLNLRRTILEGSARARCNLGDSCASYSSDTIPNGCSSSMLNRRDSLTLSCALPRKILAKNGITYSRSSRLLGKGSFGFVYLGMDVNSGRMIAIKFLPMPSGEEEVTKVETEVVAMRKVKSKHVVQFISYAFQNNLIIIIMECMMAGSLKLVLGDFGSIPPRTVRLFIRDVLRGLYKLHSNGIIHRDVKPQNVLLTLCGTCKISDFGASAFLHEVVRKQMEGSGLQVQGTPVYLAPEAARGKPVEQSDIWSCGIMFLQLLTGELPYPKRVLEMAPQVLIYQIGSAAARPVVPDNLDEFCLEFANICLKDDPSERKSAEQLLQLPIFSF
uniref:Putative serine/threonine protein kinase n=1 Tax=Trypanosoma congolense (strain IL3000) TaxID=1068625 RepID=G0UVI7_TRYCI|nr:putative serine/threonine protein kinase [Trypanosoma congolense IL3000]